ncbi:TetR/AcrR family transcriptional regulator [Rhizohabitans arisaemae]|uniref:TetR/AcrR family transcriptional regulator n=1 Tax=Rhizohabitans arisaemae TaxID=2720610 RepID=UPI0024B11D6B|nr:TetR/AcrR family transcriptional regulator [Rhizohabitans arisaemae]
MATTNQSGGNRSARGGRIKAGSSRRAQSEQTELHLLRTATWLFSERGFHGTGIRDIAEAAGVAVSAMYYYASSKDELLEGVMRRTLDVLVFSGQETLRDVVDPAERLAAVIASHVAFHARNPRAAKVADYEFHALTGQVRQDVLRQRDAYETVWSSILQAGVHDGTFKDRGTVARLALLQMTTGVAHWYRPKGELSIPQLCERFAEMGLALMGASLEGVNLPDTQLLLRRAELTIEPRERPSGL